MTAVLDARAAWLERRRSLITASDAAAILGQDERRGPLAVYAAKVGGVEAEETLPMRRGRRFEEAIAEEYAEETGRIVFTRGEYELAVHPDIPWLAATPDRLTAPAASAVPPGGDREAGPLQIKLAIGSAREWKDDAPLGYQIQVQIEIACTPASWGCLAGLVGPGPLAIHDLPRNDRFLAAALPRLEEFLLRVQRREPPEADALPGTTAAIKRLWADGDGSTVPLPPDALELADRWEAAKAGVKEAENLEQELENKLRAYVGGATYGALADGSFLTLQTTNVKAHMRKATSYRALRRWRPKIRNRR